MASSTLTDLALLVEAANSAITVSDVARGVPLATLTTIPAPITTTATTSTSAKRPAKPTSAATPTPAGWSLHHCSGRAAVVELDRTLYMMDVPTASCIWSFSLVDAHSSGAIEFARVIALDTIAVQFKGGKTLAVRRHAATRDGVTAQQIAFFTLSGIEKCSDISGSSTGGVLTLSQTSEGVTLNQYALTSDAIAESTEEITQATIAPIPQSTCVLPGLPATATATFALPLYSMTEEEDSPCFTFVQSTDGFNAVIVRVAPVALAVGQEESCVARTMVLEGITGQLRGLACINPNCWVGVGESSSKNGSGSFALLAFTDWKAATKTAAPEGRSSSGRKSGRKSTSATVAVAPATCSLVELASRFTTCTFDRQSEGIRFLREARNTIEAAILPLPAPLSIVPETVEAVVTAAGLDELPWSSRSSWSSGGTDITYQYPLPSNSNTGSAIPAVLSVNAAAGVHTGRPSREGAALKAVVSRCLDDATALTFLVQHTWNPAPLRAALRAAGGVVCLGILSAITSQLESPAPSSADGPSTLHLKTVGVGIAQNIVTLSRPLGITIPPKDLEILYRHNDEMRSVGTTFTSTASRLEALIATAESQQQEIHQRQAEEHSATQNVVLKSVSYKHKFPFGNDLSSTVDSLLADLPATQQKKSIVCIAAKASSSGRSQKDITLSGLRQYEEGALVQGLAAE